MKVQISAADKVDLKGVVKRSAQANTPGAAAILKDYLRRSIYAWTGLIDGDVACIWGLIAPTILSDKAYLWLLTTDLVDEHQFIFVRHSQLQVQEMLKEFPTIVGHVKVKDERAKRWLRWLGVRIVNRYGELQEFELKAHG
jgi:hypothetical protein